MFYNRIDHFNNQEITVNFKIKFLNCEFTPEREPFSLEASVQD